MKASEELQNYIKKFQGGDAEVFENIYKMSYPYLYTCVIYLVKNEDTVQDILQDVYIDIINTIGLLKNPESFYSWAAVIANRKCFRLLKTENKEQEDILENVSDDDEFIPENFVQDQEKQRLIREIIDGLTDNQRFCVIAYYYNQFSYEEIAKELDIPVNTVKSHLNRAKMKIKEEIIKLDKEKGTRLYAFAPFLLLFFGIEAKACETSGIPEMSDRLTQEVKLLNRSDNQMNKQKNTDQSGKIDGLEKAAKGAAKTKLYITLGAAAAVVIVIGAVVFTNISNRQGTGADNSDTEYVETQSGNESEETENMSQEEEPSQNEIQEPEEDIQTEPHLQELFVLDDVYENYGYAHNGVMTVKMNGKWGAIDYRSNVIIPCEYDSCYVPDDSGNIVFINTSTENGEYEYFLYDHQGNLIYQGGDQVRASGGMYITLHQYYDEDYNYYTSLEYHRMDGTLVYSQENVNVYDAWINIFYDGVSTISDFTDMENGQIVTIDTQGNVSYRDDPRFSEEYNDNGNISSDEEDGGTTITGFSYGLNSYIQKPIRSTMNHGYYFIGSYEMDPHYIEIYDDNDNCVASFYYSALYMDDNGDIGITSFIQESNELYNDYLGYYVDGGILFNYGPHMVFIADGKYVLVDFSKHTGGMERSVSEDIITAVYDYISMADEKYWLVQSGDKFGYIDHDGNEIAMYDDAAAFAGGFALIIENGEAWLINEDMEKLENIGQADGVASIGELFVIHVGDEKHIYQISR